MYPQLDHYFLQPVVQIEQFKKKNPYPPSPPQKGLEILGEWGSQRPQTLKNVCNYIGIFFVCVCVCVCVCVWGGGGGGGGGGRGS